jgi:hypothetical protein
MSETAIDNRLTLLDTKNIELIFFFWDFWQHNHNS